MFVQAAASNTNLSVFTDEGKYRFSAQLAGQELARSVAFDSDTAARAKAAELSERFSQTADYEVQFTETRTQNVQRPGFSVDLDSYDFTQVSSSGTLGFEPFQGSKNNLYYFHFNGADGKAILFSQAYAAEATRDNGIRSVIQNGAKDERYEMREDDGKFYFILKAVNGREVARSRTFGSRADVESAAAFLKANAGNFAEQYKKPEPTRTRSGNPPVDKYNLNVASASGKSGFEPFKSDASKQHYFHFNNASGQAILFSQGYGNIAGRDNGIRSVIRNAYIDARYHRTEKDGKPYFILKSGNNQEVSRSAYFASTAEMEAAIEYLKAQSVTFAGQYQVDLRTEEQQTAETRLFNIHVDLPEPVADSQPDRNIDQYDFTQESASGKAGFETFYSEKNQAHYFHYNDENGKAILFSESYPNPAVRDNGVESVKKNAPLENRWKIVEEGGQYYYTLRAGNNQEIARGPMYDSEAGARAKMSFIQSNPTGLLAAAAIPVVASLTPSVAEEPAMEKAVPVMEAQPIVAPTKPQAPPVAKDITFGTIKSDAGSVTIDPLVAADGDGSIAKYIVTSLPPASKGVLLLDGIAVREQQELAPPAINRLQFKPKTDMAGHVYFKYEAVDSNNLFSNVANYTITVEKAVVPVAAYVPPAPAVAEPLAAPAVTMTETAAAGKGRLGWLVGAAALAVVGGGLWWYLNREPKVPEPVAAEMPAVEAQANTPEPAPVAAIENFQPIALYFNNDHPNPRTTADKTSLTYGQTYDAYVAQKGRFESEYGKGATDAGAAKQEVGAFFDEKVKKGFDELTALSDKLLDKLKEGNKVEITVTGFASPLASSEYNKNLTSRRVSSIENHLRTYKNGQFKEYMDKGMLAVTQQTSGEEAVRQGISDDRTNTRASWYSPSASAERRVEITNVTVSKP